MSELELQLNLLVDELLAFGGAYVGEFGLECWPDAIRAGAEGWLCRVEVDARNGEFSVLAMTPVEAVERALLQLEALKREKNSNA